MPRDGRRDAAREARAIDAARARRNRTQAREARTCRSSRARSAPDHRGQQHAGDERDADDGERVALEIRARAPQAFLGRLGILVAELARLLQPSLRRLAYLA